MLAAQSPVTPIHHILLPKSGRKPLQPKNIPADPPKQDDQGKLKAGRPERFPISPAVDSSNKENNPVYVTPVRIESMDSSLAEELSAVREKLERLRLDKEKTEKMLRERDKILDLQVEELNQRGVFQKELEIEVDRLYRLKQLQVACMVNSKRMSPFLSLRVRELEKKNKEPHVKKEEMFDQSAEQSPSVSRESASDT
ncbi:hypothetical protein Ancab_014150 [Ancistrocladus abbreviatus]